MRWGWSQPGQAPGTAGGRHTQTACLTEAWPGLEQGPPQGPGKGTTGAPGGVGRRAGVSMAKQSAECFEWQHRELCH